MDNIISSTTKFKRKKYNGIFYDAQTYIEINYAQGGGKRWREHSFE